MSNEPPVLTAPASTPSPEERDRIVREAQELSQKLIMQSVENSTAVALLAAESFIAYRTAGAQMPLQDVMDNIWDNLPGMYLTALKLQIADTKGEKP